MKNTFLFLVMALAMTFSHAQEEVKIDGRLKPLLDDFFEYCNTYNIEYHDNFFKLKNIAIVDSLVTSPKGSTLGMLVRDEKGIPKNIIINWVAQLDPAILKIVAFHEFGHYFLEYGKHVCGDCPSIMATVNTDYFSIAQDWDSQVQKLFIESPIYVRKKSVMATNYIEKP